MQSNSFTTHIRWDDGGKWQYHKMNRVSLVLSKRNFFLIFQLSKDFTTISVLSFFKKIGTPKRKVGYYISTYRVKCITLLLC